ncbi:hypothetical protein FQZ97_1079330 [compost metagenome]
MSVHLGLGIHRIHELNDEILLVAQAGAGIDGALDSGANFLVFPRTFFLQVLLDQQQNVVDVDFHLLDELDLEDHVVVDRLLLRFGCGAELGIQVQIDALVILVLPFAENLVPGKIVESRQDIFQPQDRAKQLDEGFLRRLADDGLPQWEFVE